MEQSAIYASDTLQSHYGTTQIVPLLAAQLTDWTLGEFALRIYHYHYHQLMAVGYTGYTPDRPAYSISLSKFGGGTDHVIK